jgi:5-methylcytosine-specific restriction protein A
MAWENSTRRQRLPADWDRRQRYVLRRDHRICHVCKKPGADEVDHVKAGDDHSYSNLAAIHRRPCHARKSAREGQAASARARARRQSRKRQPEPHPGTIR